MALNIDFLVPLHGPKVKATSPEDNLKIMKNYKLLTIKREEKKEPNPVPPPFSVDFGAEDKPTDGLTKRLRTAMIT